ncbi:hypothetical protein, partial [[Ruminococcus] torques]|uniref:hypothetical protein n=1 Tax=[Ruminococcus] torques TaxID=33039 RepID=UPI0022E5846E
RLSRGFLDTITGSTKRHIPGVQAVAKVTGKPGLWLIAIAKSTEPIPKALCFSHSSAHNI